MEVWRDRQNDVDTEIQRDRRMVEWMDRETDIHKHVGIEGQTDRYMNRLIDT
jgi:hypothetical protein